MPMKSCGLVCWVSPTYPFTTEKNEKDGGYYGENHYFCGVKRVAKAYLTVLACVVMVLACSLLTGCSPTKYVPQGQMLLDGVKIEADSCSVPTRELELYLKQKPNVKMLGLARFRLGMYSLSGRDSTKWYNRWIRALGQPPVIYDEQLTENSRRQIEQALVNSGYLNARVTIDSVARPEKRRMSVTYKVDAGQPYRISSMTLSVPDSSIAAILRTDTAIYAGRHGEPFNLDALDNMRFEITKLLRNKGYYAFKKDDVAFVADTTRGSSDIALTLRVINPGGLPHEQYYIRNVYFITDYNNVEALTHARTGEQDTVEYKGVYVIYGKDRYIRPSILYEKCFIQPGAIYNESQVSRTYEFLSQLSILKYINIDVRPAGVEDGQEMLDAYVLLSRNRLQNVTFSLEGTNSEGDLGVGGSVTYRQRNLTHRSDELMLKARASYEHLGKSAEGFVNNRYTEYAGEVSYTIPKFEFPFIPFSYRKRRAASTEFAVSFNYQERPEYTRVIAGAAWKYKWTHKRKAFTVRHTFDLVDINYVRLPKSTLHFLDSIAPANPLLRYSYEDHFIMRMGYSFYRTNRKPGEQFFYQPTATTIRGSFEIAGNLLYALSALTGQEKSGGVYKIFGIQYAQYVKAEADWTRVYNLTPCHAVALHAAGGVAVPYLNSRMVPFEKRFYAGGANGVRGWGVRSLGPGCYASTNNVANFINQCGDILLTLNLEYRLRASGWWQWLEGAFFIDAGNIWTIRNYENQPGGEFKIDQFYKQIAASYGAGIRLNFSYFVIRFDAGMKAHNPARGQRHWPLVHPRLRRDCQLHFAIGYPF